MKKRSVAVMLGIVSLYNAVTLIVAAATVPAGYTLDGGKAAWKLALIAAWGYAAYKAWPKREYTPEDAAEWHQQNPVPPLNYRARQLEGDVPSAPNHDPYRAA